MPFTLIRGTFHVVGYSPDGDSLRFQANNNAHWKKLSGRKVELNKKGHAQLRFEGVDTPETHFSGKSQPAKMADASADFTLQAAGIKNVQWGPTHYRVVSADDGVAGYILSRSTDPHGRPVSFVFAGNPKASDGSSVHLGIPLFRQSLNYKLAAAGHAYPMYYVTLFYDLRNELTKTVKNARKKKLGVWAKDKSKGFTFSNLESITENTMIFPKLFRRLVEYYKKNGKLAGFHEFITKAKEGVTILPQFQSTHFDTAIIVNGKKISMITEPENLIFDPK